MADKVISLQTIDEIIAELKSKSDECTKAGCITDDKSRQDFMYGKSVAYDMAIQIIEEKIQERGENED